MKVRFRMKGQVKEVEIAEVPSCLINPQFEGIDLTKYPVIFVAGKRHTRERAEATFAEAKTCIVVYTYSWVNGWGDGVLLPKNFDNSRVKYYRTKEQLNKIREEYDEEFRKNFLKEAREVLNEDTYELRAMYFSKGDGSKELELKAYMRMEVFCFEMTVYGKTVTEIQQEIERVRPQWEWWNNEGLRLYEELGIEIPIKGNIELKYKESDFSFRTGITSYYSYFVINNISYYYDLVDNKWVRRIEKKNVPIAPQVFQSSIPDKQQIQVEEEGNEDEANAMMYAYAFTHLRRMREE